MPLYIGKVLHTSTQKYQLPYLEMYSVYGAAVQVTLMHSSRIQHLFLRQN